MSAPQGPPPAGGNQDRGPSLIAMFWTECMLAMIIVGLRFYARISMRNLGVDDWMMLITVTLFLIMTCFVTYLASIGGGRHLYYLTPEQTLQAVKWTYISEPWGIFLFATGKASVAILILRISGKTSFWRRCVLYAVIVSVFVVNSLGCIFIFVQCNPPRALWTPDIPSHCWHPGVGEHYVFFLAAWNIFLDVLLALFPITIFWNLKMDVSKRVALCCLLGLGLVAALFSGIKIQYMLNLTARSDYTWKGYNIEAWTGAEGFVMIICGNIPPLKPLWERFVTRKVDSNYNLIPTNYRMNNYHPGFPTTSKRSPTGENSNILSSQPENWPSTRSQVKDPKIKVVSDIDVVECTNFV